MSVRTTTVSENHPSIYGRRLEYSTILPTIASLVPNLARAHRHEDERPSETDLAWVLEVLHALSRIQDTLHTRQAWSVPSHLVLASAHTQGTLDETEGWGRPNED